MGISLFNTGYDLQKQLDGVKDGIAIVATGNTHAAITSGQYVYIQEHGTLAEGMYRATANIAENATLSGSNVTAVSGGGLNALNSNLSNYPKYTKVLQYTYANEPYTFNLNEIPADGVFLFTVMTVNAGFRYNGILSKLNQVHLDVISAANITVTVDRTGYSAGTITITITSSYSGSVSVQIVQLAK